MAVTLKSKKKQIAPKAYIHQNNPLYYGKN